MRSFKTSKSTKTKNVYKYSPKITFFLKLHYIYIGVFYCYHPVTGLWTIIHINILTIMTRLGHFWVQFLTKGHICMLTITSWDPVTNFLITAGLVLPSTAKPLVLKRSLSFPTWGGCSSEGRGRSSTSWKVGGSILAMPKYPCTRHWTLSCTLMCSLECECYIEKHKCEWMKALYKHQSI